MKMRKLALLVFVCCISFGTIGQPKGVAVSHYIFPSFIKGKVLMKNGIKDEALINYNSITEQMIFENKGTKLAMSHLENIDTVYISDKKFVVYKDKFIEVLYKSNYELYAAHKCKIKDPGKPAAYGGTSQTSSSTSYSSYFTEGQVYEMELPSGFETSPYVDYFLKKDGEMSSFVNLRQLSKLFSTKEEVFKSYVKKNNVKYENQKSVIDLIRYMETN